MDNRLISLEKVLNENAEDFIIDSNVLSPRYNGVSFLEFIYDHSTELKLDEEALMETAEAIQFLNNILEKYPNAHFIKEVKEEWERFLGKVNQCYEWYKKRLQYDEFKISLLENISDKTFNLVKQIKRKEIRTHGPLYTGILECVKLISVEFDKGKSPIKRFYMGKERKKENTEEYLGTDEKIIGMSFFKTLAGNKNFNIMSNDRILRNKFVVSYRLLSCKELQYGLNELKSNDIKFFTINPKYDVYVLSRNTQTQEQKNSERNFVFYGLNPEENENLKYKINNFLCEGRK